jgi:hypothetical protein
MNNESKTKLKLKKWKSGKVEREMEIKKGKKKKKKILKKQKKQKKQKKKTCLKVFSTTPLTF